MEIKKLFVDRDGYRIMWYGDVYSLNHKGKGEFRKIKQSLANNGYKVFWMNGKCVLAHRIIAESFVPNPYNLPLVDHINTVRTDNRVFNLRWVDASGNALNPITRRRQSDIQVNNRKTSKKVYQYDVHGVFIQEWSSTNEVHRQLGCSASMVSACCRGIYNTVYGYQWRYEKKDNIGRAPERCSTKGWKDRKLFQYSLDGTLVKEWESLDEAAKSLGKCKNRISENCLGRTCSAYGFIWSYSPLP